jgi:hypothetical protein
MVTDAALWFLLAGMIGFIACGCHYTPDLESIQINIRRIARPVGLIGRFGPAHHGQRPRIRCALRCPVISTT